MKKITILLKTQWLTDFRQQFAIASVLLFLVASSFIIYQIFGQIQKPSWNALYWIIFLFSALNLTYMSFGVAFQAEKYFLQQHFSPLEVYFSKVIYNMAFLMILGALLFIVLSVFGNFPVIRTGLFFLNLVLVALGFSAGLSFLSALSASASSNSTLMTVLSLPALLPIILLALKITAISLGIVVDSTMTTDFVLLLAVDGLILGLSIILFPYLWKS